ncbi:MAG: transcription antitermination factor NusB [Flavobacteriaceae bacterium]|nr:MAG: transcription antitermination factor NusB [Flavobacteriaceae bacterium]
MINRRHIRVKVMQSVYALFQSKSDNLIKEENFLMRSIDEMGDLHALLLRLFVEVRELAETKSEISKKKYLASSEEKNPNRKFIDNLAIKAIAESFSLSTYIEDKKLNNWKLDDEFVRIICDAILASNLYESYMSSGKSSFAEDKEFVISIFKDIIAPNEKLADYFEGINITWVDDIPFVNTWVLKELNSLKENKTYRLGKLYKDAEDKQFVLDLFRKVVLKHQDFDEDINDKTPNWDSERIAEIDLILMKMALSEFIHFPSIPTKVSMNEYIEISKDYSSQKSSFFINGVLDKILKQYDTEKKIKKTGRGLM